MSNSLSTSKTNSASFLKNITLRFFSRGDQYCLRSTSIYGFFLKQCVDFKDGHCTTPSVLQTLWQQPWQFEQIGSMESEVPAGLHNFL